MDTAPTLTTTAPTELRLPDPGLGPVVRRAVERRSFAVLPLGPPASVQIQCRGTVVDLDDPELRRLADRGALKKVTGHGELELADGCFLRLALPSRVPVYALGVSLWQLMRDPLGAGRVAQVDWSA